MLMHCALIGLIRSGGACFKAFESRSQVLEG